MNFGKMIKKIIYTNCLKEFPNLVLPYLKSNKLSRLNYFKYVDKHTSYFYSYKGIVKYHWVWLLIVILCRVFGFLMTSRRNKKPKQFRPEAYGLMIALMGFLRGLDPQILVWKAPNQWTTNQRGSQICMCVCVWREHRWLLAENSLHT